MRAFQALWDEYTGSEKALPSLETTSAVFFDPNDLGFNNLGDILPISGIVMLKDRLTPLAMSGGLDKGDRYPERAIDPRDTAAKLICQLLALEPLHGAGLLSIMSSTETETLDGSRFMTISKGVWSPCVRFEHDLPRSCYEHFFALCADHNWKNPVARNMAEALELEIQYWSSRVSRRSARLNAQERVQFLKRAHEGALHDEWIDKSKGLHWREVLGQVFRNVFLLARGMVKASEYSAVYFTDDYRRWQLLPKLIDLLPVDIDSELRHRVVAVDLAKGIELLAPPDASFDDKVRMRVQVGPSYVELFTNFHQAALSLADSSDSADFSKKRVELAERLNAEALRLQKEYYRIVSKYGAKTMVSTLATVLVMHLATPLSVTPGVVGIATLLYWLFDYQADLNRLKDDPLYAYALRK